MKKRQKLAALLLVPCLVLGLHLPVAAADVAPEEMAGARWLEAECPSPTVGDERVLFALLRGGFVTGLQEYTQGYLRDLMQLVEDGGAEAQSTEQIGWQLLVLAAAGVEIHSTAPTLVSLLGYRANIEPAAPEDKRVALLVFGTAGVPAAGAGVDLDQLAAEFVATANADMGFGPNGVSGAADTSRAIQALATFAQVPGVEDVLIHAQFWQQQNASMFGGFEEDGAASAAATAEAILSMSCMGYDPASISNESASMTEALKVFQTESGGFAPNPDSGPDLALTALCQLALTAKVRYDRGKVNVFDCADATATGLVPLPGSQAGGGASGMPGASGSQPLSEGGEEGGGKLSLPVLLLILAGVMALVVVLAVVIVNRGQKKKKRKTAAKKPSARRRL